MVLSLNDKFSHRDHLKKVTTGSGDGLAPDGQQIVTEPVMT